MNKPVRVRFAPSPTGYPHVGNIRTAMFNWLLARHTGGRLILRIEDTDVARRVDGAVEAIMDGLKWMGLDWDEGPEVGGNYGPYCQSQRLQLYEEAARRLVEQGDAYYCYCSPKRLEEMRAEQVRQKQPPGYDRLCRNLGPEERVAREAGITPVVRFRTPLEGQTSYNDVIWGDITFENSTIDDFVLLKSDGYPTYKRGARRRGQREPAKREPDDDASERAEERRGNQLRRSPRRIGSESRQTEFRPWFRRILVGAESMLA